MGCVSGKDCENNEKPIHMVTLKPFQMGKYEVTQNQWSDVMGSSYRSWQHICSDCPVDSIDWDHIKEYLVRLNLLTGKEYRLPTEAKWEYAARAGSETSFPWGDKASHDNANYGNKVGGLVKGKDKWEKTSPVGSFPANAFGLHDMHGNVIEWTEDCWNHSYVGAPTDGSAWRRDGGCSNLVVRGGAWFGSSVSIRSASRFPGRVTRDFRNTYRGFRVVLSRSN